MNVECSSGNYIFQPGGSPYSSGVRAQAGYEIVHVTLMRPAPLAEALTAIAAHLARVGRPAQALCGLELRCPQPYSFEGFAAFNDDYRALLHQHQMLADGPNAIARTNIAPLHNPPLEQRVHAFSYTAAKAGIDRPSFVISGAGELVQASLEPVAIVRPGETSEDALREKAALVMDVMESRLDALGVQWSDVTVVNIYTVHNLGAFLRHSILERMGPAARLGVHWYLSRPPVRQIEFEMDMRGLSEERYEEILRCGE